MKYKYNIRLTESEAKALGIKFQEPVTGRYPKSTDWEVIIFNNITYLTPARFTHTKKFQWEMHPKFEWKAIIYLNEPLHSKHMFFKISEKKIIPLLKDEKHIPIMELITNALPFTDEYMAQPNCLYWHPKTKDLRSDK